MSDRSSRVRELFDEAVMLDVPARRAFVDEHASDDPALAHDLLELLEHDGRRGSSFLCKPVVTMADVPDPLRVGETLASRYRIVRRIGAGGMGVVYEAVQSTPVERRVAVKVVRVGLDSEPMLRVFHDEQRTLARMNHAGVASVFDAGATGDGRPFLVMELVEGERITTYCDEHGLDIDARLDLFARVCEAVRHAHQKGIVHRDIKPSNVMIGECDGDVVVKIIDFGVARLIHERDTGMTQRGELIGTPNYVSPEQVGCAGSDVDTRADVYALGVLLVELLAGGPPIDIESELRTPTASAVAERLAAGTARRPSAVLAAADDPQALAQRRGTDRATLQRRVRGDLDWIAARALAFEPDERYASVEALLEDVRHHLADEPVAAGSPSARYRMAKFVRRHRTSVVAGLSIAAVLVLSSIACLVLAVQMMHARTLAETRAEQARAQSARASIAAADGSLREGDVWSAERHLANVDPSLRDWEWWFLFGQLDESEGCWDDPLDYNESYPVWSADGQSIMTLGQDDVIRLRDVETGEVTCSEHVARARTMAWSTERDLIGVGLDDGRLRIASRGGDDARTFHGHLEHVTEVQFDEAGSVIASLSTDRVILRDVDGGDVTLSLENDGRMLALDLAADGRRLAVREERGIRIYDTLTSAVLHEVDVRGRQYGVSLSPDGERLAYNHAGTAYIVDVDSGEALLELDGGDYINRLRFSPDGALVATTANDRAVRLWDASSGAHLRTLRGHGEAPAMIEWHPSGERLLTTDFEHQFRFWRAADDDVRLGPHRRRIYCAAPSSDAARILTADSTGPCFIWNVETADVELEIPGEIAAAGVWTRDDSRVVIADSGGCRVIDAMTGDELAVLSGRSRVVFPAVSADGRWIVTCGQDVIIWDAETYERVAVVPTEHAGLSEVALSADSRLLVAGGTGGIVVVVDLQRREIVHEFKADDVRVLDIVIDPRMRFVATGGTDKLVRIWDVATWAEITNLESPNVPRGMAINPSGTRLVAGTLDGRLRIWDTETFELVLRPLQRPSIWSLSFTDDGRDLVTTSNLFAEILRGG